MFRAHVRFRLPDGRRVNLGAGSLIGRIPRADLWLDDARVSEAHAWLSLRGGQFELLALRGGLAVRGRSKSKLVLVPGREVEFAEGLTLLIEAVELPQEVLALIGFPRENPILDSGVYSLVTSPVPTLEPRFLPTAPAHIWSTGEGWRIQIGNSPPEEIVLGQGWEVDGFAFAAQAFPLAAAELDSTMTQGRLDSPLRLVARYDTVHIHRKDRPVLIIGGLPARIVGELVAMGGLAPWEAIAKEIWREEPDLEILRPRWDRNLSTLRKKLRLGGIRSDLIRADGSGNLEVVARPFDTIVDET